MLSLIHIFSLPTDALENGYQGAQAATVDEIDVAQVQHQVFRLTVKSLKNLLLKR